jgi:hypothetical protein
MTSLPILSVYVDKGLHLLKQIATKGDYFVENLSDM